MQMNTHGVVPSVVTYNILIDFCAVQGKIAEVMIDLMCVCVCVCVYVYVYVYIFVRVFK